MGHARMPSTYRLGVVGPDRLFDRVVNYGHSWCLHDTHVLCYLVISLARWLIGSNICDTLENG
jgi:hypothetical protein